jgi:hypothetical protein
MRLKAYTDFINAVSRIVSARRKGHTEDELNELAALNDAKTRICICADKGVVEALLISFQESRTATVYKSGV